MAKRLKKISVFVASPSDVREERERLPRVIEELNRIVGPEKAIILELVRWETHVTPGMGRAQEIINRQIGPYDIFIGIMWKWFGTPTGAASSGTEEEFNLALASWKINRKPQIMFYFNQAKYLLKTPEEAEQVRRVLEFRVRLEKEGLIWKYNGIDNFEQEIRQHLQRTIRDLVVKGTKSSSLERVKDNFSEPVIELFDNAFMEWRRHRVFASRDRLELFVKNSEKILLSNEQLRFILESWFKSQEYNPQNYINAYDHNLVIDICIDIIQKEKDADLIGGAIKVLGDQNNDRCAEIILQVIEDKNRYIDNERLIAVERFWFSKVAKSNYRRIPIVLISILQSDSNYKLRKGAAYAIRNYPSNAAIAALEKALKDSRSQVRYEVVSVLSIIRSSTSVGPLLDALEEEKYSVKMRKNIVGALGAFPDDLRIRNILESITTDTKEDSQVVKEAKWSLMMIVEK